MLPWLTTAANRWYSLLQILPNMSQDNFEDTPSTSAAESAERKLPWDLSDISSSTQQRNHLRMPMPSSAFVPTINAIASSQDLQWMVQPAVLGSMASPCVPSHPYSRPITHTTHSGHARPGVIHAVGNTSWQRKRAQQLSPEEEEKQRLRRERNKLAAAKCRNRRRELTDLLQGVSCRLGPLPGCGNRYRRSPRAKCVIFYFKRIHFHSTVWHWGLCACARSASGMSIWIVLTYDKRVKFLCVFVCVLE